MDEKHFLLSNKSLFETTIKHLKFISKIKRDEKINTDTLSIVKNDYYSRVMRTKSGQSRKDTIAFFKTVLNHAIQIYQFYSDEDMKFNKDVCDLLIKNIEQAKKGLLNSAMTYSDDADFGTEIETIIELLDIKLFRKEKQE